MASSGSNSDEPSSSSITDFDGDKPSAPITIPGTGGDQTSSNAGIPTPHTGSFRNDRFLGSFVDGGGSGTGIADSDEFGFTRPEFRQCTQLAGTVKFYERHVFLCYKNPTVWPSRFEASESDPLPRLLSAAVLARTPDMMKKTRLTICEGHGGTDQREDGHVLIFPDMIRYRTLAQYDVDTFVEEVLVKNVLWMPGSPERLLGSYIFVCCHGSRDRRCGECGPALVTRFKEEIASCRLQGRVSVKPCSHVGGHQYAGNVIIFGSDARGKVSGHWYGYVTPEDVHVLLQEPEDYTSPLWRGEMGITERDQKLSHDFEIRPEGGSGDVEDPFPNRAKDNSSYARYQHRGLICCQNAKPGEGAGNEHDAKVNTEEKIKNRHQEDLKGGDARRAFNTPSYFETWGREDTYTALSVVCAAAAVAIAYSFYKRSG